MWVCLLQWYIISSLCAIAFSFLSTVKCWDFCCEEITRKWARKEGERHTTTSIQCFSLSLHPPSPFCVSLFHFYAHHQKQNELFIFLQNIIASFFYSSSFSISLSLTYSFPCLLWRFKKPWKFISVEITWKNNAHMRAPDCFYCKPQNKKERNTKEGLFMNEALSHCDVPLQPLPLHKVILSPLV